LPPYTLPPGTAPAFISSPPDVLAALPLLAASPVVGMDCEWGPDPPGSGRPARRGRRAALTRYAHVETLQLATRTSVFVFDVRALVGAAELDALLSALFTPPAPLLAGHSLKGDLARLAACLAHLPVFGGGGDGSTQPAGRPAPLAGHVDLVLLSRAAAAGGTATPSLSLAAAWPVPSLAKLTAATLGAHLDKAVRRSDWTARPLSPAQLAYAGADAHVCVALFDALAGARAWGGGEGEGDGGGGGGAAALAASPAWLAFLANGVRDAAGGRGGGGGGGGASSSSYSRPAAGPGSGAGRRERTRARQAGEEGGGLSRPEPPRPPQRPLPPAARRPPARETAVDVAALLAGFLGAPLPAGGRPAVVAAAAGLLAPGAGPDDAAAALRAAPPAPRGGVLEFSDAAALLVNFTASGADGDSGPPRLYSNRFSLLADGGVAMSWWPSPGQGRASRLTRRLLGPDGDGGASDTPVLLFARLTGGGGGSGGRRSPYTCLGRLEVASVDWAAAHGAGEVAWRLVDVAEARRRGGRPVAALLAAGGLEEAG
jgi:hypothetical protein